MHKCMQWCLQNRIKIHVEPEIDFSIKPAKTGKYRIIINDNGKTITSEAKYSNPDACTKVWELYCYLYKKNN